VKAALCFIILFTSAFFIAGCSNSISCTQIGCSDGVFIEIPGLVLPEHYVVTLNDENYDTCLEPVRVRAAGGPFLTVNPGNSNIVGGNLTRISLRFIHADGASLPTDFHLSISSRADCNTPPVSILEQQFTVEYTTRQPNGPRCEPTCSQASVTLPLQG